MSRLYCSGLPSVFGFGFWSKAFLFTWNLKGISELPMSYLIYVSRDKAEIVSNFEPDAIVSCPYKDLLNIGKFTQ